jgi:multidrug efflux pump subunit AcrB
MWIVELALRRPYTVAVMSILILTMGVLSLTRTVVDIFPTIDIPVVAVVWSYPGLPAEDMERRVVLISERAFSTTVNGIERIESNSIPGVGLMHVYFQPGTDIGAAIAQIASVSSTILRITPPGMTPPNIVQFNASNVPVAQMTLSKSDKLSEQQIFDYGLQLHSRQAVHDPRPIDAGAVRRQAAPDQRRHRSADGRSQGAFAAGHHERAGVLERHHPRGHGAHRQPRIQRAHELVAERGRPVRGHPVKIVGGQPVLMGDVAHISDSFADQTNIVHVDGKRATYLAILKHADASTLAVVEATRDIMPAIKQAAPDGLEMKIDFDQSLFVRGAIKSVLREGLISSVLVSIMIGLFLGSWRSMLIVCTSIPLAICTAIIGLHLAGHTINIMTLGGLSLAIGMLVDDATVEVENIHRNRGMGKPLTKAILDGASQIAVPAIVATLAICIVFFPVVLLFGPAKFLFVPLALSVVLAMLASYLLSRTLVPTLARMLMASEHHGEPGADASWWTRFAHGFNAGRDKYFDRFQEWYGGLLESLLHHRGFAVAVVSAVALTSFGLAFLVGTDFFPTVDAGLMKIHFRAPAGTRIENTDKLVLQVEERIRAIIPADELETINDMIGVPLYYNLAFVQTDNIGPMDADILIALKEKHHATLGYTQRIREVLAKDFPESSIYFQPADIISQVLNFGLSAPLDVQIDFPNLDKSYEVARRVRDLMRTVPGTADVHIAQVLDYPTLKVDVDRERAAQLGLTQRDVASSLLVSLSSSALVAPSYFLNPVNNVNYTVVVKTPLQQVRTVPQLMGTPLTPPSAGNILQGDSGLLAPLTLPTAPAQTLSNISNLTPEVRPNQLTHYTVQRVLDVEANVEGRDLGAVSSEIQAKLDALKDLPKNLKITVRGQNEVMNQSFHSLGLGLIFAILLVYCLMVVLYQSWIDPLIIIMAVPGALVGILWMLALTHTTLNVESLMGAIMAVGIAVSNSILLVNFANDFRTEKPDATPFEAALDGRQDAAASRVDDGAGDGHRHDPDGAGAR